jgi:hypothetical protein
MCNRPTARAVQSGALFGFHIGRPKAPIRRAGSVDARFEFYRLFDQDGREFGICSRSGEFEQRRRLTHEIKSAYHGGIPLLQQ